MTDIINVKQKADPKGSAFSVSPGFEIEKCLLLDNYSLIAGVDEVGRGALAGPLCLGLVIFDKSVILNVESELLGKVNDSKKMSHSKRLTVLDLIRKHAVYCSQTMVSHKIVDQYNINGATKYALNKLLVNMTVRPDIVLMDGNFKFSLPIPFKSVIKGDQQSISIASASIIAKVYRDSILDKFDTIYTGYDLHKNKGYGTKKHREAIREIGFSTIHRKTYEPVKSMVAEANTTHEGIIK